MRFATYYSSKKIYLYKTALKNRKWRSQLLKTTKPKKCQKMPKNKTNLQQCNSSHITIPKIIHFQNDAQELKIMFPATKID